MVDLPGNRLVEDSVRWSKQMLAASEQRVEDLDLRWVDAGRQYPPPGGTLDSMRWFGAGWPDYTWLFGTDGEYTAYAAVAAGQFAVIKDHLRALRDVSEVINPDSGKIVHEVTPDGAVYFGADADPGNTDESSKYPSAVALVWRWTGDEAFLNDLYPASKRAMEFVAGLDEDEDGWPGGLGNVERPGMGEEKLDNAVYTIRGYADLADMAAAVGDDETRRWAVGKARAAGEVRGRLVVRRRHPLLRRLAGGPGQREGLPAALDRADSDRRGAAAYPRPGGRAAGLPGARRRDAERARAGVLHRHDGPVPHRHRADVGPGRQPRRQLRLGGLGRAERAQRLHAQLGDRRGQRGQLRPARPRPAAALHQTATPGRSWTREIWEMPGAMPEIVPGGDFGANIDRLFTERSMVLQAWGAYGVLWPVVHQWLGVSPDLGRGRLAVVPQLPPDQRRGVGASGSGWATTSASTWRRSGRARTYVTEVRRRGDVRLTIGAVVPRGSEIRSVRLDGERVRADLVRTARGLEVRVPGRSRIRGRGAAGHHPVASHAPTGPSAGSGLRTMVSR